MLSVVGETDCEPLVDFVPDHAPEAEQEVASVELQVSVDEEP